MAVDVERLTRVLKLEAADGYQNLKVVRGLEAFIANWVGASLKNNPTPLEARLVERVAERLTDYGQLGPIARAQAIQDILEASALVLSRAGKPPVNSPSAIRSQPAVTAPAPVAAVASASFTPPPPPTPVISKPKPAPLPKGEKPDFSAPITTLKGVGESYARLLEFINVRTINDALYYFPFRHEDFSSFNKISGLMFGQVASVLAQVIDVSVARTRNHKDIIEVSISDETGMMRAIFFNRKQVYSLKPGCGW